MPVIRPLRIHALAFFMLLAAAPAGAAPWQGILDAYRADAAREAGFAGFSAARGERFFQAAHGTDWRCTTCHTRDPRAGGRHEATGKAIEPLAPSANPARLSSLRKVEKWFRRNCRDVVGRVCSALEKGDVVRYLISLE